MGLCGNHKITTKLLASSLWETVNFPLECHPWWTHCTYLLLFALFIHFSSQKFLKLGALLVNLPHFNSLRMDNHIQTKKIYLLLNAYPSLEHSYCCQVDSLMFCCLHLIRRKMSNWLPLSFDSFEQQRRTWTVESTHRKPVPDCSSKNVRTM